MKSIQIIAAFALIVLPGCDRSESTTSKEDATNKVMVRRAIANPAGAWEGVIHIAMDYVDSAGKAQPPPPEANAGQEGKFFIKLSREGDKWIGYMRDYGDEKHESYLPLATVKVEGSSITFGLGPDTDSAHYVGKLSDDGKSIAGTLFLGSMQLPLKLNRKEYSQDPKQANSTEAIPMEIKAQRLMVWSGGQTLVIAGSSGGSSGGFMLVDRGNGNYSYPPEQAGTEIVYFRDFDKLSGEEVQLLREKNIKPGSVYIRTADGLKFIKKVDTRLTDQQVAAQFGIK